MTLNLLISIAAIVGIVVAVAIIAIAIGLVSWGITCRNNFVKLDNASEEAFASIDVFLKKRYDLIPNLVETVKGYAKHESETLEKVIAARNNAASANTTAEKIDANANLSNAIKSINVVAEKYPELKANTNFLDLQNQLKTIESDLERTRRYYNGTVKTFNTRIRIFPANIIARWMHLEKKKYFELDSEEEKKNVKVSF
jgi:LemA protein